MAPWLHELHDGWPLLGVIGASHFAKKIATIFLFSCYYTIFFCYYVSGEYPAESGFATFCSRF
jgi:hypothetical protein